MKLIFIILFTIICASDSFTQGDPPWRRPLKICFGNDGINFLSSKTFQDSAGVPSVIRMTNGSLLSAFQWFRQPVGSVTWDRVAIKISTDNGISWTQPVPINVNYYPSNFQRPFDPALALTDSGKIRLYFSGGLSMVQDTSVITYSAISDDGINYTFENNIRFSLPDRPVLDPAVIKFNNMWHLVNPANSGSAGAYHNISSNGLDFIRVPDVLSDIFHSWIGNFLINDTNELRFYGSGMIIWFSSSPNGGVWSGYTNTNVTGGDPAVLKISSGSYLMIYTGLPYPVSIIENSIVKNNNYILSSYPNPFNSTSVISYNLETGSDIELTIFDLSGRSVRSYKFEKQNPGSHKITLNFAGLASGVYYCRLNAANVLVETETAYIKLLLLK